MTGDPSGDDPVRPVLLPPARLARLWAWRPARLTRDLVVDTLASGFAAGGGAALPAWLVLLPIRLFLAAGWLRAGGEKFVEPGWFQGEGIRRFLDDHAGRELPFMTPIAEHVLAPMAAPIAVVVAVLQLFCGVALLVGRPLRVALAAAMLMNLTFTVLGAVNPSAFYIVFQLVLILAVATGVMGTPRARPWVPRTRVGVAWIVLAALLGPFVRTIDPHLLVEDPAAVLSCQAFIIGVTIVLLAEMHSLAQRAREEIAQAVPGVLAAESETTLARELALTEELMARFAGRGSPAMAEPRVEAAIEQATNAERPPA